MRSAGMVAMILGLFSGIAIAQRFDAASIKRPAPDSESFMKAHPGGRLEISRATLRTLTALAWRLEPFQVSGGPAWVRSEYFNVNTTAAEDPSEDRLFLMIRNLLAERFALKAHFETAERSVYFLVPGKRGRRSAAAGLQISAEGSCTPEACGSLGMGVNHLEAHEIPMGRFAEALSRAVDRRVIDRTGRAENFDISLRWQPDERQLLPSSDAIALPTDTPSIFTALEEQLGLKLERGKAAVDLLVIDHAERPTGN